MMEEEGEEEGMWQNTAGSCPPPSWAAQLSFQRSQRGEAMPEQDANDALLNGERGSEELVMSDMPTNVQDKYTILQLTRTKTSLQESNGNLVRQILQFGN